MTGYFKSILQLCEEKKNNNKKTSKHRDAFLVLRGLEIHPIHNYDIVPRIVILEQMN